MFFKEQMNYMPKTGESSYLQEVSRPADERELWKYW